MARGGKKFWIISLIAVIGFGAGVFYRLAQTPRFKSLYSRLTSKDGSYQSPTGYKFYDTKRLPYVFEFKGQMPEMPDTLAKAGSQLYSFLGVFDSIDYQTGVLTLKAKDGNLYKFQLPLIKMDEWTAKIRFGYYPKNSGEKEPRALVIDYQNLDKVPDVFAEAEYLEIRLQDGRVMQAINQAYEANPEAPINQWPKDVLTIDTYVEN